jgi:hypothetical protein
MEFEIRNYKRDGFEYFSKLDSNGKLVIGRYLRGIGYHHSIKPIRFTKEEDAYEMLDLIQKIESREWNSSTEIKLINGGSNRKWLIYKFSGVLEK